MTNRDDLRVVTPRLGQPAKVVVPISLVTIAATVMVALETSRVGRRPALFATSSSPERMHLVTLESGQPGARPSKNKLHPRASSYE
jgi:hypothetical protein